MAVPAMIGHSDDPLSTVCDVPSAEEPSNVVVDGMPAGRGTNASMLQMRRSTWVIWRFWIAGLQSGVTRLGCLPLAGGVLLRPTHL